MSQTGSTRGSLEQRPRIPKLTYRNAIPTDSLVPEPRPRQSTSTISSHYTGHTDPTVSTNLTTAPPSPVGAWARPPSSYQSSLSLNSSSSPRPPRSPALPTSATKKSLFSGIFSTREPSMAAFEQMKQIEATNPNLKSYTSSQQLPSDAPRVDSKWDGMPKSDHAGKAKSTERPSMSRHSFSSSGSAGRSENGRRERRLSASTLGSFSSHGRGKRDRSSIFGSQHGNPSGSSGLCSVAGESVSSDADTKGTGASIHAASLKSPSLPDLSAYFAELVPELPAHLQNMQDSKSLRSTQTPISVADRFNLQPLPTVVEPADEQTSPLSLAPPKNCQAPPSLAPLSSTVTRDGTAAIEIRAVASPKAQINSRANAIDVPFRRKMADDERRQDLSPVLPENESTNPALIFTNPGVVSLPSKANRKATAHGFLAGEAQPLELSDDDEEAPPWTTIGTTPQRLPAPSREVSSPNKAYLGDREKRPNSSRLRLGLGVTPRKSHKAAHSNEDGPVDPASATHGRSTGLFRPTKLGIFNAAKT